jgi:transposase
MKEAQSKVLGHLGLVAGIYDKLGLSTLLNKLIPVKSEDRLVDTGTCVKGLVLNGLGFLGRRLYLVSHFLTISR